MKKTVCFFLAVLMLCSLCIQVTSAEKIDSDISGNGTKWEFFSDGTLYINGTGAFPGGEGLPEHPSRNKITKLIVSEGITSLGRFYFCDMPYLEEVILPSTLKEIGSYCFMNCSALKNIVFGDNITTINVCAFKGCSSLEKVMLPEKLKSLIGNVFEDCTSLKRITIPEGVEELDFSTFNNCTSLEEITVPKSVTTVRSFLLNSCTSLKKINFGHAYEEFKALFNDDANTVIFPEGISLTFDGKESAVLTVAGNSYAKELSLDELKKMASSLDLYKSVEYTVRPSLKAPYKMGSISRADIDNTVQIVNFFRAIARLDNVTDNNEYNELAQAASLVNSVNNHLTHYPNRPAGMKDSLYKLGATGASSSNIAVGYKLSASVFDGYLDDSDNSNIDRVGHRRWLLCPTLDEIGVGYCEDYSAIHIYDCDNTEADAIFTAWPGGNSIFPAEFFKPHQAMSIQIYDGMSFGNDVNVTVTRKADGKSYTINSSTDDKGSYFNINSVLYGYSKAVIFRIPEEVFGIYTGEFNVKLTGVFELNSSFPIEINYDVNMLPVLREQGDTDNDGIISAADARKTLRYSVDLDYLLYEDQVASDMNHDGIITASDARSVLRKSVGLGL